MKLEELIPSVYDLIPFDYSHIRQPQYDEIIDNALQKAPASAQPRLIHMLGIPGSGKSTFYRRSRWDAHILVSFDKIMENLPGYIADLPLLGNAATFKKWEMPARIIGYELLRRAVTERKNIFFDHGGLFNLGVDSDSHLCLLHNLNRCGYQTEMYYISCPPEVAFARTVEREKITCRHTPESFIRERGRLIDEYVAKYSNIVDTFYIIDNSNGQYLLKDTVRRRLVQSA